MSLTPMSLEIIYLKKIAQLKDISKINPQQRTRELNKYKLSLHKITSKILYINFFLLKYIFFDTVQ